MAERHDHGQQGAAPHTHEHGTDMGPERPPFSEEIGRKGGRRVSEEAVQAEEAGLYGNGYVDG